MCLIYGLPRPTGFRPVDAGLLNRSYQVFAGGRGYFLKHYLPWRGAISATPAGPGLGAGLPDAFGRPRTGDATLRWQHGAAALLAGSGFPAAAPLTDRSGANLVYLRNRPFALFPWRDGVHRTGTALDPDSAHHLGATLAALHTGLAAVLPPAPQPLFATTKSVGQALAEARTLLDLVRARTDPDEMDALAEYRLLERRRLVPEVAHLRPGPDQLGTVGYIHGDFHAGNVLWSSDGPGARIAAVLDWEKTTVGPLGDEVVAAAIVFFTDQYTGLPDLELIRAFIAGYTGSRPRLTAAELAVSVRRVWWERLTDFWILVFRYQLGDPRPDSLFPGTAALVPWWTENYAKVLEGFLDGVRCAPARSPDSATSPLISALTETVLRRRQAARTVWSGPPGS